MWYTESMEKEMKTTIKIGDTVYFKLEDIKTYQPWKEGKVLEIKRRFFA